MNESLSKRRKVVAFRAPRERYNATNIVRTTNNLGSAERDRRILQKVIDIFRYKK